MARNNLVPNPSFQNDVGGWTQLRTKAALRRVQTTNVPAGADQFIADFRSNGTTDARVWLSGSFGGLAPVTPGVPYQLSAWVYCERAITVTIDADATNASGAYTGTRGEAQLAIPAATWRRISVAATPATGDAFFSLYLIYATQADNIYCGVDAVQVEEGATLRPYADGNTAGWAWTGVPGNSTSRDRDPVADAGADRAAVEGEVVTLAGSGTDPEGASVSYAWSVLNAAGTGLTNGALANRLTANVSFVAPRPPAGPAPVVLRLTVTDGNGNTGTDDVTVTVRAAALVDLTGSGGVVLGGAADASYNRGNDVVGGGGLVVAGDSGVLRTLSERISGAGGTTLGGSALADLLFITPRRFTGDGGGVLGGDGDLLRITPTFRTGAGGVEVGGNASFRHRAATVPADVVIEWDLDGDGDFSTPAENITDYVVAVETLTGRDYPSQLTGRAGPGKMKVELLNRDNRFTRFNAASPLNAAPYEVRVGTKIRLRTREAVDPDPRQLLADDFGSATDSLATVPGGPPWSGGGFGAAGDRAVPVGSSFNAATLDAGQSDYLVQATLHGMGVLNMGTGNVAGLLFRWVNTANYSRLQYNAAAGLVQLVDRVAGSDVVRSTYAVESYDGMVLTVRASAGTATCYVDGVQVMTGACLNNGSRRVGICGTWASATAHGRFGISKFRTWDRPAGTADGILWTGYVQDIVESVELGPQRFVSIEAEGALAQAADAEVVPTNTATGRYTGMAIGNTLARADLLYPPGPIARGDVFTGAFGFEKDSALEIARTFEEAELGFLYETQEGHVGFESRSARAGRVSRATFADNAGAQLGFHSIEPRNWRREIVNKVEVGIASQSPTRENRNFIWTNHAEVPTTLANIPTNHLGVMWIRPSDAPTPIARGQLLLAIVAAPGHAVYGDKTVNSVVWLQPSGWVPLDDAPTFSGDSKPTVDDFVPSLRVYAKIADGTESAPIAFAYVRGDLNQWEAWYGETYNATARTPYICSLYNLDNFFGDVKEGVTATLSGVYGSGSGSYAAPTVFPDWGPDHPSMFITAIAAANNSVNTAKLPVGPIYPPPGYRSLPDNPIWRFRNGGSTSPTGAGTVLAIADAAASVPVESPGSWVGLASGSGHKVFTVTVAVRGKNGSPPVKNGHVTVTRENRVSQRRYRMVRTHREENNLLKAEGEAVDYAWRVMGRHATERPILALSFHAATTRQHRTQAFTRRVGDQITVQADQATGMGYSGDYYIESIAHRIANGGKTWEVTYELSPWLAGGI